VRKSMLAVTVPLVALLAAACGSSSTKTSTGTGTAHATKTQTTKTSSASPSSGVTVATKTIKPYGAVLVNGAGRTLYIFAPDKAKKVTCVSACATIWPPAKLPPGTKATASGQVKSSLLGSDPNPSGGRVVTYNGWPLYTYVTDTAPGVAHGQGINSAGGLWYVISPSGKVIKSKKSSSSSSSSAYG
jgi:predicted lipoprotein with Yx(FWY)xxD motif